MEGVMDMYGSKKKGGKGSSCCAKPGMPKGNGSKKGGKKGMK